MGEKVSRVGFDWPDARGSRAKVSEEIGELDRAIGERRQDARSKRELGDVLFALVNLARHHGVDAERRPARHRRPLRAAASPTSKRAGQGAARRLAARRGRQARRAASPLEELDGYWNEAKRAEDSDRASPTSACPLPSPRLPRKELASGRALPRSGASSPRWASRVPRSQIFRWIHQRGVLDAEQDDEPRAEALREKLAALPGSRRR